MNFAGRRTFLALASTILILLGIAGTAQAELSFDSSFGGAGAGAGQLSSPAGLAVNTATNDVYVADRGHNRIEQFTEEGEFERAWGYDVVSSGPDDKSPVNEVDEVRIRASSGTFSLIFKGAETTPLAFNATSVQVESALNALSTISTGGGSVAVSGGPGDPTGTAPYQVAFNGGPLAATNVQLSLNSIGLGLPSGTVFSCLGGSNDTEFTRDEDGLEYQWLANGQPVPGATESTFTPGAEEAGKTIQCRVSAVFETLRTVTASRPYFISTPASGTVPPLGPAHLASPSGKAELGGPGGGKLKCSAGSWSHEPTSFTYQWYRNGDPVGQPNTSVQTEDEYTLTEGDLQGRAVFQCAVTGTNAGGASTTFSALLESDPKPQFFREATVEVSPAPHSRSAAFARVEGGPVFEICQAGDTCKSGVAGAGAGELGTPRSVAVDNSPAGQHDVYVIDDENPRVQKFDSEGHPILSFGREVDQTTQEDVCTVASGDACGPGVRTAPDDLTPAGFGIWPTEFPFNELGNELAVDPAGNVYVGDARDGRHGGRLQKFDSGGHFLSQALLKTAVGPGTPISVAVDSQERAYSAITGEFGGALRTLPSEFSAAGNTTDFAGNIFHTDRNARQLAVDPRNDRILVSDVNNSERASLCGGPATVNRAIVEYDPAQHEIDCSVPNGAGAMSRVNGIAVSGDGHLYVSVGNSNVIKKFSVPTSTAATVGAEKATDITTTTARLHGEIGPGFEDTTYSIEYGTAPCPGPCQTVDGGVVRGLRSVDGSVPLSGLEPGTTYYYRVNAENGLGSDSGELATFTTYQRLDLTNDPCPNALARKQTKTIALLDCRAYELASAGSTGGYDVVSDLVAGQEPFDSYPDAPGKVLYGVKDGGIPGTGNPTNRGIDPYLATRGENGWTTKYVGIPANDPFATSPFSSTLIGADSALDTLAFGGPEICDHCFADGSSGIPVRAPDGQLTQGMSGEFAHPETEADGYIAEPLSANGAHLIFGSTAQFAAGGNDETGDVSLYDRNLETGETHVISYSSTTAGAPLACLQGAGQCHSPADPNGLSELAMSPDGSHVLLAQKVDTDADGNVLWHLYLNVEDATETIDLTPGTTTGVYFDGMNASGDRVFFTTADKLLSEDEDESGDIYESAVSGGVATLRLVSTLSDGSPSNSDTCAPPGVPDTWNSAGGDGKCSAVAFAGGAGLASDAGTFFFVTPEQLEAGKGTEDQPNLYAVEQGGQPTFVATIDSSLIKPPPPPALRPLVNGEFAAPFEEIFTGAMTVDQADGDVYVLEPQEGRVFRFDSAGAPANFSAGSGAGSNVFNVPVNFPDPGSGQVAVDNSPASASTPLSRALYVASSNSFLQPEATVAIFAPSGAQIGALNGSTTNAHSFTEPCGAAVDQSSGTLYVADRTGFIYQYTPNNPSGSIDDGDYTVKGIATAALNPCALAVDGAGHLYVASSPAEFEFSVPGGPVYQIDTSAFASGSPPLVKGTEVAETATSLAADPFTNELYVNETTQVSIYDATGTKLLTYAQAEMSVEEGCGFLRSRGIAVNTTTHHSYVPCVREFPFQQIKEYGSVPQPYKPIDNPAVVHGVAQPGTHDYGDFQVTADGAYAAFPSAVPIKAGYDNAVHLEVYRYDIGSGTLTCVSCNPTGTTAQSDSTLPSHGIGMLEDGRVFFNSADPLTLSDTNGRQDAYEWSPERESMGGCFEPGGCQRLISTGTSSSSTGVLGASSDGKDVYFFTRDSLVPEDRNGKSMKIYDAREGGGFFVIPPPPPCAASDECHGPSTQAAEPSPIGTLRGTGGQGKPACRRGFVRRNGHCVKKKRHHHKRSGHHIKRKHSSKWGGRR